MTEEKKLNRELIKSFKKVKLTNLENIYVTSNLSSLGKIKVEKQKKLKIIEKTLQSVLSKNFSIFSPAASMNLCNTSFVYDPNVTPSHGMGPLSEYFRKKKNSVRSLHPFWSICCNGKNKNILKRVSRHAYGIGSPWSKMLELDTMQLNLGINPERAVTLVHHLETVVGVPYRFNKEFHQPVKIKKKIKIENFYLSTRFKNLKIEKKKKLNKHFFDILRKQKKINYTKTNFGLEMWSFKMIDFYKVALKCFTDDIYNYLEKPIKINLDI